MLKKQRFQDTEIYKLHKLIFYSDGIGNRLLAKLATLSYMNFLILVSIDDRKGCTQKYIAEQMNLTNPAVSKRIEKLVRDKLLTREVNLNDRRANAIKLTQKGKDELEIVYKVLGESAEKRFAELGEKRTLFNELLDQLIRGYDTN